LVTASFVSGGMIPKLRAVKAAMDAGVRRVRVGRTVFGGGA
jgi:acetylglutamate kinase